MNTFEFVGKLVPCKETDNFKPFETKKFPNGDWGMKSLKFNAVCGTNRHTLEISELINMARECSAGCGWPSDCGRNCLPVHHGGS